MPVLLVRDPHDAYGSCRKRPTWFERWAGSQVRTPYAYGQVWRRLAESFLTHEYALVRHEDLFAGGEAVDRLEQMLGAKTDRSVFDRRIGDPDWPREGGASALELRMLDRAAAPIAARLGYATSRTS